MFSFMHTRYSTGIAKTVHDSIVVVTFIIQVTKHYQVLSFLPLLALSMSAMESMVSL